MRERATKKQKELLDFIDGFIKGNGYGPSYREIMHALDYKSVSTVATHVNGLITRGYLRKGDDGARSLKVVTSTDERDEKQGWLRKKIQRKITSLKQQDSAQARKDVDALTKAAELLDIDLA